MAYFFAHTTGEPYVAASQAAEVWLFIWANLLPFLILGFIWLSMSHVFKAKVATRLIVVMTYLLLVGVTLFQTAPAASIISLMGGFGLALSSVIGQAKR